MTYYLIALVHIFGFSRSTTGVIQIKFHSKEACERNIPIIKTKYQLEQIDCVEIQ
jgi:hypothetical protein